MQLISQLTPYVRAAGVILLAIVALKWVGVSIPVIRGADTTDMILFAAAAGLIAK